MNTNPQIQIPLPNSTAVLVLGILSLVACCFFGIFFGIFALYLAGKANQVYWRNPELYTLNSFNNIKVGKICAIIGLILTSLATIYYLMMFVFMGATMAGLPFQIGD